MGTGRSGLSSKGSKRTSGPSGENNGSSTLPPLPETILGRKRIFHDMMNSPEARGSNAVRFTSDLKSDPAYGYYAEGSYEVLTPAGTQRRTGKITAYANRLYGIETTSEGLRLTDLKTGMLISERAHSEYSLMNSIAAFADSITNRPAFRESVKNAEERFNAVHRR